MALPGTINRTLLGPDGYRLSDQEYVCSVAHLGIKTEPPAHPGAESTLRWDVVQFMTLRRLYTGGVEALRTGSQMWPLEIVNTDKRLFIDTDWMPSDAPDLADVARVLGHPLAELASVSIGYSPPRSDDRWEWPLRIAAFPDDFSALDLQSLAGTWPASKLTEPHAITRDHPRTHVLVVRGDARDALRNIWSVPYPVRAAYCILLCAVETDWRELRLHVDALAAATQAAGVSLAALPAQKTAASALNEVVRRLSHDEPLDQALFAEFDRIRSLHVVTRPVVARASISSMPDRLIRRLDQLPPSTTFDQPLTFVNIGWDHLSFSAPTELMQTLQSPPQPIPYKHENWGALALVEMAAGERNARRAAAGAMPPRFLQARLSPVDAGEPVVPVTTLIVDRTCRLSVFIGELEAGALHGDQSFPDRRLDWDKQDSFTLQLVFSEPHHCEQPLRGKLVLSRHGKSTECVFEFTPKQPGSFAGRVVVLHRGRVLQTAMVRGKVFASPSEAENAAEDDRVRLEVPEVVVRHDLADLDDRPWFDASLVLNHTAAEQPTMLAAARDGAYIASLSGIDAQLQSINGLLNDVALKAADYHGGIDSTENAKLLVDLANEGVVLYRNLVEDYINQSSAPPALAKSEYLQIVSTRPDALVPLEFVYEYPSPVDGAPVCKNARAALRSGECPADCMPTKSPAPHVCPLGFWGLSKVIERYHHEPKLGTDSIVFNEPGVGRKTLKLNGRALVAASNEVPAEDSAQLRAALISVWNQTVSVVGNWTEWQKAAGEAPAPVLIVALPHAAGAGAEISLEIGGEVLKGVKIDRSYVRCDAERPPIAVLLGCDTVNVAYTDAYARHIAVFRQAGAALVLGTVATVLGADAAKMAAEFIGHLAKATLGGAGRFGEVLRQAKREAVAESQMIALCLVAFGDADWNLE